MPMDDPRDLRIAALEVLDVHELLDELRRARADDVPAEHLAVLLVADDLHEPRAVAVHRPGADRAVLQLPDDDVVALVARLVLRQPEAADVRRAERRPRDVEVG